MSENKSRYEAPANVKPQSRRESGPVIDETAFEQLLSAAYVMQEHNSRLKNVAAPKPVKSATAPVPVSSKTPVAAPIAPAPAKPVPFPVQTAQAKATCQECGSALAANEFFCDNCGAPAERTGSTMQKNWASLWEMHQASETDEKVKAVETKSSPANTTTVHSKNADEEIDLFPAELEEIVGKFAPDTDKEPDKEISEPEPVSESLTVVTPTAQPAAAAENNAVETTPIWTSAAKARAWLDSIKSQQHGKDWFREEWNLHRGIIAIALASAVLLAVLFQWAMQPPTAPGQTRQLSGFEQLLVSMGLAEAPAPSSAAPLPGNPNTKVWVDVHTALYYCPGADLYGKTSDGRYTSQADAQRDNFQPSTLKACD